MILPTSPTNSGHLNGSSQSPVTSSIYQALNGLDERLPQASVGCPANESGLTAEQFIELTANW